MANRVWPTDIRNILVTTATDNDIEVFITSANLTVTKMLGNNTDISDDQLKEIERWLTAHLIASTKEPQAKSEKDGDASISYQGETGKGLSSTFYGQQVKLLDTTGILASRLGKKRANLFVIESFDD